LNADLIALKIYIKVMQIVDLETESVVKKFDNIFLCFLCIVTKVFYFTW